MYQVNPQKNTDQPFDVVYEFVFAKGTPEVEM